MKGASDVLRRHRFDERDTERDHLGYMPDARLRTRIVEDSLARFDETGHPTSLVAGTGG
jgi:hypothetical protein